MNSDNLVEKYKHKRPLKCQEERADIINSLKLVDGCFISHTLDKLKIHNILQFNQIYIGDDWKGDRRWVNTEKDLSFVNAQVIYIP